MKNIVVAAFALLLAYYGPQLDQASRFDSVWMLGILAILAGVGGQLAQALRLPALIGWVVAGLMLGSSGLQLVHPDVFPPFSVLLLTTGLWVGFQVGLHVVWPVQLDWRGPMLMAVATALILLLVTVAVALIVEPPWGLALLLGALASLWGPFTALPGFDRRGALLLSVLGGAVALLLLSGVIIVLQAEAAVEAVVKDGATGWVGRVWLSLAAGGGLGLVLRFTGLLRARLEIARWSAGRSAVDWGDVGPMGVDGTALRPSRRSVPRASTVAEPPDASVAAPGHTSGLYAFFRANGDRAGLALIMATERWTLRGGVGADRRTVAFAWTGTVSLLSVAGA